MHTTWVQLPAAAFRYKTSGRLIIPTAYHQLIWYRLKGADALELVRLQQVWVQRFDLSPTTQLQITAAGDEKLIIDTLRVCEVKVKRAMSSNEQ